MNQIVRPVKNLAHLGLAWLSAVYFGFPAKSLTIIGVTGTDGKTTTSTLMYHLLKTAGFKVALISTVAAYIGDEAIDTGFHVTSPNAYALQQLLARIKAKGFTHVVLESTSHGLDQHRLYGTWMRTAVLTNITHEHLDYHKTYQNYVAAKAKLFKDARTIILNHDDVSYDSVKQYIPVKSRWIAYSRTYDKTRNFPFTVDEYAQLVKVAKKRFTESYNVSNTLAAAVAAYINGVPFETVLAAMPTFPGIPGRMQEIVNQKGILSIVDFAHTPNALEASLTAAKKRTKGKLIAVFGAAGQRDASKRPLMGKVAATLADEVVLTSEDNRFENPKVIIQHIKSGATERTGHLHGIVDRRQAIRFAVSLASAGDTVIVCGKGHERSMNTDGIHELPWSDADVLQEEIQAK